MRSLSSLAVGPPLLKGEHTGEEQSQKEQGAG